jgi:acyl-homoserine-lactone acylase
MADSGRQGVSHDQKVGTIDMVVRRSAIQTVSIREQQARLEDARACSPRVASGCTPSASRWRGVATLALLSAMALGCTAEPFVEPRVEPFTESGSERTVQIRRTSFGIPHILADDEAGLGMGIGYAYAQDNLCLLAEEIVTVNGERSLHFGPDATYEPSSDGTPTKNFVSDVYFAVINAPERVAASWASQPVEIQDLVTGYARGVNRFLHDAGGALPDACRGQRWVREITELDIVRILRRLAGEASSGRMIEGLVGARPPVAPPPASAALPRGAALASAPVWDSFQTPLGSNGIALGRDATESRAGLLLASPHFPWAGVLRFYQLHITIPGKVDAMGATPGGLPVVAIGHNAHVAWTHTVNSSVHFTFHQLTLDPTNATRYVVDGESRPMTVIDVEVKLRLPSGELGTRSHRVWSSEYGPMVVVPGALGWSTRNAFALGDANADNIRSLEAWWEINKSRSLTALRGAVEGTLGIPWVNTIAVDAAGTAYLGDVTPVPNLPDDPRCIPLGFGPLASTGTVVLDASTEHCDWKIAPGTPLPGIVPAAELPTIVRTDFVQNSNDSAWLSNPAAPITGFSAIVSRNDTPQNSRTRIGLSYLTGELAAGRRITSRGLLDFAFSNRALHAASLLADLGKLCAAPASCGHAEDLAAPCDLLARWDGTANLDSVGWPVYQAWRKALDTAAAARQLSIWRVPFDPADPIATPRGLRIADPAVAVVALDALTEGMSALDLAGIDADRPWGEIQQVRNGDRVIPIHGGGGSSVRLDENGNEIYNKINSRLVDGRLEPFFGTSIVMAISFEGGTPEAYGALAYSQSSDPASPHFADQTERFSQKDWISFPYTEAAIQADPALTVLELTE